MIKLPKEIVHIINVIETAGYEAYAVGGCVRDSILGRNPEDWDLTSNASRDTLGALFPNAMVVNKQLGVIRITEGEITVDIAAYRIDGIYKDYRRPETVVFTEEIDEDLKRRDFTMNAIAVNPDRGIVDPFNGRSDIEKKVIRGIGEPCVRFEEDALRILRGIRFAAQLDFEVDKDTLLAMTEKKELLMYISMERIREEFYKTITARSSGKGLWLYAKTGVLTYILGENCIEDASEQEMERLSLLAEKIDQTDNEFRFRAALIYLCFEKNKAFNAIERMGYSNEMKKLMLDAVNHLEEFRQIRDKVELKRFIARFGLEGYHYLIGLLDQQCKVFFSDKQEIYKQELESKITTYELIQNSKEPVFIRDLAVNGDDLKKAGILEGKEIGRILDLLLDLVHVTPEKNEKTTLLQIVKGTK